MPIAFSPLPGLSVSVDRVRYEPRINAPPERPHPFVYYISIHNSSEETVTIVGRKWIITDLDDGSIEVVEGEGVVGQSPRIEPGKSFSYDSFHRIRRASTATGSFFGRTDANLPVMVRIPHFRMEVHQKT